MLGARGYATKKALKDAVGQALRYEETSLHGTEYRDNGKVLMVGPNAYTNRSWYATITMKNGLIAKVQ